MSVFFEYCVKCGKMFQDENAWLEHRKSHTAQGRAALKRKAFDEVEKKAKLEVSANVPGDDREAAEDTRLARTQGMRDMKKALKEAGIECQTMNAEETQAAFAKLQAEKEEAEAVEKDK